MDFDLKTVSLVQNALEQYDSPKKRVKNRGKRVLLETMAKSADDMRVVKIQALEMGVNIQPLLEMFATAQ